MADGRKSGKLPAGRLEQSPELVRLRGIAVSVYGPTILVAVGQGAILPLVALSARALGASLGAAALIVALTGLGQLIGDLPAGALAARIGEKRALIAACAVDAIALVGAYLAQSLIVLAVAITVTGLAHAVFGLCLLVTGQREASIKETALGVSLNPNNATLHGFHGTGLAYCGQPREGLVHLSQASRLSPLDPLRWYWAHASATACYFLGDYEACVSAGQDCCRMRPDLVFGYRALVAGLAELGQLEEARRIGGQIYDRFPDEVTAFLRARWPEWPETHYARYVAALAKGGLSLADGQLKRVT